MKIVKLPGSSTPAVFYLPGKFLQAFRFVPSGDQPQIESLGDFRIYQNIQSYDVLDKDNIPSVVVNYVSKDCFDCQTTYQWNQSIDLFEQSSEILVDQKAEDIILRDKDYKQGVTYIESVLSRPVTDKEEGQGIKRPLLWYLLGLSNELTGDNNQAAKAYWQVWHSYPDSPYAIMSKQKIELIK